jgi:hypothetical protein
MKQLYILLIALTVHYRSEAQLYYPPGTGTAWETLAASLLSPGMYIISFIVRAIGKCCGSW